MHVGTYINDWESPLGSEKIFKGLEKGRAEQRNKFDSSFFLLQILRDNVLLLRSFIHAFIHALRDCNSIECLNLILPAPRFHFFPAKDKV